MVLPYERLRHRCLEFWTENFIGLKNDTLSRSRKEHSNAVTYKALLVNEKMISNVCQSGIFLIFRCIESVPYKTIKSKENDQQNSEASSSLEKLNQNTIKK